MLIIPSMPEATDQKILPPIGDPQKADKYIQSLINLINSRKIFVSHTDLSKFDPSSLEDHYRIDLKEYSIEVSHSKDPDTSHDSYVMVFTNIKNIVEGSADKTILAFMYLNDTQFHNFKEVALDQITKIKQEEEEKRLTQALEPIDQLLLDISNQPNNQPSYMSNHTSKDLEDIDEDSKNQDLEDEDYDLPKNHLDTLKSTIDINPTTPYITS